MALAINDHAAVAAFAHAEVGTTPILHPLALALPFVIRDAY